MKQRILATVMIIMVFTLSLKIYASTPPSDKHEFKVSDREINFEVERKGGEIALYFQSQAFSTYDEIQVERSGSDISNFSVCKTLELSQLKLSGDYYKTADRYPLNAQKDCYYRIKVVGKDGSMKTFPPVLLTALTQ